MVIKSYKNIKNRKEIANLDSIQITSLINGLNLLNVNANINNIINKENAIKDNKIIVKYLN